MDSSDKEIIKEDMPEGKTNRENYPEIKKTENYCQEKEFTDNNPINSQMKKKSESRFENQKQSTDNVQKESDDSLIDCANTQDTDLTAGNVKTYKKHQSFVILPCNKKESGEYSSRRTDQFISEEKKIKSSEESNSVVQEIKASIIKYFLSVIDQSEKGRSRLENTVNEISNNIIKALEDMKEVIDKQQNITRNKPTFETILDSKNFKYYLSNKDKIETIDDNLLKKEQEAGKKPSKFLEKENTCTKYKHDKPFRSIVSPGKRKSEEIAEDEIKSKRSAGKAQTEVINDENLTKSAIAKDSALYSGYSKKCEKHLVNTEIIIDDVAEERVKEQDIAIVQMDQSAIKYKETTSRIDYETKDFQTSDNKGTQIQTQSCDKVLVLEVPNFSSTGNCSRSLVKQSAVPPFLDNVEEGWITDTLLEIKDESPSEGRLRDSKKNIAIDNLSKFQDSHKTSDSELAKNAENKSGKFPNKVNPKVSCNTPLQMSQNSAETTEPEVSKINESNEYIVSEHQTPRGTTVGHLRSHILRHSSVKLFSDSERDFNLLYNKPESKFVNLERLKSDPKFIEHQKRILESISYRHQRISSIALEPNLGKFPKPLENEDPGPEIPITVSTRFYVLVQKLAGILISEGEDVKSAKEGRIPISCLIEFAEVHDPDIIPYIPIIINQRQSIESSEIIKSSSDTLPKESLETNDRNLNPIAFADVSADKCPPVVNLVSPISSPPKNEDNTPEKDSPKSREYPGLASDLSSVKKDARYQKRFYRDKNPVILPINWNIKKPTSSKLDTNDSAENQIHGFRDDPRVIFKNRIDDVQEEKCQEVQKILFKDEDLIKEREPSQDMLSVEEPREVENDSTNQKSSYWLRPITLKINRSADRDTFSIVPNIDYEKNEIQRINDNQWALSRNNQNNVHAKFQEDEKILSIHKDVLKEKGRPPQEKLSRASHRASEYEISSFMEESPYSSPSNSPKTNKESILQSIAQRVPQLEECSMSFDRQNFSSPGILAAGPSQSPGILAAGPSQSPGSLAAGPSQSPGSLAAGPSQSPGSLAAGPSQSPGSLAAGPSQSPGSLAAGPSQSPDSLAAGPSQSPGSLTEPPSTNIK